MYTILIIEDNCDILENLVEYLELVGFKTLQAHTGKQGVELFTKFVPDLIICDIMMPEMNGYEVLSLLMDNVETYEIPFIFSTSTFEKKDIEEALIFGADNLITKPYQLDDLTHMIEDLIGTGSKRHNVVY
jgi:CheY-like chemotaxis protein